MYKALMFSLLATVAFSAEAKIDSEGGQAFSPQKGLDLSGSFAEQQKAILAALQDGKTYVEISQEDAYKVRESLHRISNLLGDSASVAELQEQAKVQVFNEQEQVNTLLTKAHDDSRLVCRREKKTGSNRPVNTCETVAERRRMRDDAVHSMQNMRTAEPPTTTL